MKLLHVAPFYDPGWQYGGMARAATGLCVALARRGHAVTVATARLAPEDALDEMRDGVRVLRLPGPRALLERLLPWGRGLSAWIEGREPAFDVAHIHGHRSGLALSAARALAHARVPYVLQPHGTYPTHGQLRTAKWAFDRLGGDRVVAGAAALVAVSRAEARDLPRPAHVVPNGVEPCGPVGIAERPKPPRLLFVGSDRFRRKRADRLPRLLADLPGVELDLVGAFSPSFPSTFGAASARVHRLGVLSGAARGRAYAEAHLLVHPAVAEAFGLVPFEAALSGTAAVVAGDHGCGDWFAQAGGCVIAPDDSAALLDAVRRRLADPALAASEAQRVAAFARRELTWDRAAAAIEGVYREASALGAWGAA